MPLRFLLPFAAAMLLVACGGGAKDQVSSNSTPVVVTTVVPSATATPVPLKTRTISLEEFMPVLDDVARANQQAAGLPGLAIVVVQKDASGAFQTRFLNYGVASKLT